MTEPGGALELDEERVGEALVLRPEGRIEGIRLRDFEEQLARRVDGGDNHLVVDFERVEHIDGAGLRTLLNVARRLDSRSGRLALCGLRSHLREAALRLSGPSGGLAVHATLAEAVGQP